MADQTDIERLIESLKERISDCQCKIVSFSDYGRFPSKEGFAEILKISLEISHIEYALNLIE